MTIVLSFLSFLWRHRAIVCTCAFLLAVAHNCQLRQKVTAAKQQTARITQLLSTAQQTVADFQQAVALAEQRRAAVEVTADDLRKTAKSEQLAWIRQFEALQKARHADRLQTAVRIEALVAENATLKQDSAGRYSYQDEYLTQRAEAKQDCTIIVTTEMRVPIDLVVYRSRKWLLGRWRYQAEVATPNKSATLSINQLIVTTTAHD